MGFRNRTWFSLSIQWRGTSENISIILFIYLFIYLFIVILFIYFVLFYLTTHSKHFYRSIDVRNKKIYKKKTQKKPTIQN